MERLINGVKIVSTLNAIQSTGLETIAFKLEHNLEGLLNYVEGNDFVINDDVTCSFDMAKKSVHVPFNQAYDFAVLMYQAFEFDVPVNLKERVDYILESRRNFINAVNNLNLPSFKGTVNLPDLHFKSFSLTEEVKDELNLGSPYTRYRIECKDLPEKYDNCYIQFEQGETTIITDFNDLCIELSDSQTVGDLMLEFVEWFFPFRRLFPDLIDGLDGFYDIEHWGYHSFPSDSPFYSLTYKQQKLLGIPSSAVATMSKSAISTNPLD